MRPRAVADDDGNFRIEYLQEAPGEVWTAGSPYWASRSRPRATGRVAAAARDRLDVLEACLRKVKRGHEQQWWLTLRRAWLHEWHFRDVETSDALNRWIALFTCGLPERDVLLSDSDRPFWDEQPDLLTVYRGCEGRLRNNQRTLGLSWTLDRGVAESYAEACQGPGNTPGVWEASLLKADAVAYLGLGEFEIVTPPWRVSCARWTPLAS